LPCLNGAFIANRPMTTYNNLYRVNNLYRDKFIYRTVGITGMDFFGIGLGEIVLIIIVALMVFGPGKTVEVARSLGRFIRNIRKMSSDFTSTITKEIDEQPNNAKKPPFEPQAQDNEKRQAGTTNPGSEKSRDINTPERPKQNE
jgi:sec-independent protein translocase protein TatA